MARIGDSARRDARGALAVCALAALSLGSGGPASAAAAKPDLVISSLSSSPASLQAGAQLQVVEVTRNGGGAKAGASRSAYFLSKDKRRSADDVRLAARSVPSLKRRASSKRTDRKSVV